MLRYGEEGARQKVGEGEGGGDNLGGGLGDPPSLCWAWSDGVTRKKTVCKERVVQGSRAAGVRGKTKKPEVPSLRKNRERLKEMKNAEMGITKKP